MRRVEPAALVYPQGHVISVEQQAARQFREIHADHAQQGNRADGGQGNIIRRQNAKTSPQVKPAQVDVALTRILLQQQPADKKTADGEENVHAKNAVP